jgi:hypothetical protein
VGQQVELTGRGADRQTLSNQLGAQPSDKHAHTAHLVLCRHCSSSRLGPRLAGCTPPNQKELCTRSRRGNHAQMQSKWQLVAAHAVDPGAATCCRTAVMLQWRYS